MISLVFSLFLVQTVMPAPKVGSSDPAACITGELFFNTSASAGSNIKGCTSTNTWTAQGGSSALVYQTVSATATDTHSNNNVTEDVTNLSVTLSTGSSGVIACWTTLQYRQTSANWRYSKFRFNIDGTGTNFYITKGIDGTGSAETSTVTLHEIFTGLSSGSHTVKVQWSDDGSSMDVDITTRRLTCAVWG